MWGSGQNCPMDTDDLSNVSDEQLAATAYVWRRREVHGDKHAHSVALRIEREIQRRASVPEGEAAARDQAPVKRPWWRLW